MKIVLSTVFLFLITIVSYAQIQLNNTQKTYPIKGFISYFKAATDSLSFEKVLLEESKFVSLSEIKKNTTSLKGGLWVKFTLDNQSNFDDWVLNMNDDSFSYIDFFYQEEGEWKSVHTGHFAPFSSRQINDINYVFLLKLAKNTQQTYYLHLNRGKYSGLTSLVQHYEDFNTYAKLKHFYYGGFFGILIVMFFYNLFIYINLKDKNYLYYIFTIIASLGLYSSITDYNFMLFWREIPAYNFIFGRFFTNLIMVSTSLFTLQLLYLKKYSKFLYFFLYGIAFLGILTIILENFFPLWEVVGSDILFIYINIMLLLSIVSQLFAGFYTWAKDNDTAKYYLLAWLAYGVGGILFILGNNEIIPANLYTKHAVEIGAILEVVIISLALSEKYKRFRSQMHIAVREKLTIQQKANDELEDKVNERTTELQTTLDMVNEQHIEIEKKNNDINASINYASYIQKAFLAVSNEVANFLPKHFVFFKPRDVVSGDFYFFAKQNKKIIIAAVDCTGHGVPGAMMSMIGESFLGQIVYSLPGISTAAILSQLHQKIYLALSHGTKHMVQDGMDMAICVIDNEKKTVTFSGAKRPLVYIQNDELHYLSGTRLSIGGNRKSNKLKTFETHTISFETETYFYLFTDGFQDQFGGEKDKKFMIKNLKDLLFKNHKKNLKAQQQALKNAFSKWKADTRQTDDVLVIGFKLG